MAGPGRGGRGTAPGGAPPAPPVAHGGTSAGSTPTGTGGPIGQGPPAVLLPGPSGNDAPPPTAGTSPATAATHASAAAHPSAAPQSPAARPPTSGSGAGLAASANLSTGGQKATFLGGLAPTVDDPSNPYAAGDLVRMAPGLITALPDTFSSNPVRYADGVVELSFTDLSSDAGGVPWGLTRSWTNGTNYANGFNGTGMVVTQLPHLVQDSGGTLDLISNGYTIRYFDPNGSGGYTERYFGQDLLIHDLGTSTYLLIDTQGDQTTFSDFSTFYPAAQQGTFASYADPNGNTTSVVAYTTDGKPTDIVRGVGGGGTSVTESYQFSYIPVGPDAGLMSSAVLGRQVGSGSPVTVRQVAYTYYQSGDPYGDTGDLETATVEDANGNALDTTYYRYYTSDSPTGYTDGLEYVFGPDAYGRLTAALGTNLDALTNTQVAPYADNSFQYDLLHRVTQEVAAGAGASTGSSPGLGTFTYTYTTSSNTPGMNSWAVKTVETLPDGNSNTVYTNAAGEVMLTDHHDATTGQDWDTFDEYDSLGRVILEAEPSAVTATTTATPTCWTTPAAAITYLSSSTGLITLYDYATTHHRDEHDRRRRGRLPARTPRSSRASRARPILLSSEQYFSQTALGATVYPVATQTAYRNTDGTGAETTSYSLHLGHGRHAAVGDGQCAGGLLGRERPRQRRRDHDVLRRLRPADLGTGRRRLPELHGLRPGQRRRGQDDRRRQHVGHRRLQRSAVGLVHAVGRRAGIDHAVRRGCPGPAHADHRPGGQRHLLRLRRRGPRDAHLRRLEQHDGGADGADPGGALRPGGQLHRDADHDGDAAPDERRAGRDGGHQRRADAVAQLHQQRRPGDGDGRLFQPQRSHLLRQVRSSARPGRTTTRRPTATTPTAGRTGWDCRREPSTGRSTTARAAWSAPGWGRTTRRARADWSPIEQHQPVEHGAS